MADAHSFCPVYASIEILQEKWMLHIIRRLLEGACGFNELSRAVGVNAVTLSARLDHLERLGLVTRTVESDLPPRTRYELTQAGRDLQQVIDAIACWGSAYLGEREESAA